MAKQANITPEHATHFTVTETAKVIRAILKESFPGTKFSVRSRHGTTVNVSWTDGPTADQVDEQIEFLKSAYFCGMTDYQGSRKHTFDGKPVDMGADYIFTSREQSDALIAARIQRVVDKYKDYVGYCLTEFPITAHDLVADYRRSGGVTTQVTNVLTLSEALFRDDKFSMCETSESPTKARFAFAGDDGYGYNSVGDMSDDHTPKAAPTPKPEQTEEEAAEPSNVVQFPTFTNAAQELANALIAEETPAANVIDIDVRCPECGSDDLLQTASDPDQAFCDDCEHTWHPKTDDAELITEPETDDHADCMLTLIGA